MSRKKAIDFGLSRSACPASRSLWVQILINIPKRDKKRRKRKGKGRDEKANILLLTKVITLVLERVT